MHARILATAIFAGALLGCGASPAPAARDSSSASAALSVSFAPIGHWHVLNPKKLGLSVSDAAGTGAAGLDVRVQVVTARGARVERASGDGSVRDEGGGKYSFDFVPSEVGGHAVVARVVHAGRETVSAPVAFDVVRDGEEGIRVDAAGTSFVYQIRYAWIPGDIHVPESTTVRLVFEVMRGIPRGPAIDWSKPWQNPFDHVEAAREPTVLIESDGVREQLAARYKGLGVYEVERAFSAAEIGTHARDYRVRFTFVDPVHGAPVTHSAPYALHATR